MVNEADQPAEVPSGLQAVGLMFAEVLGGLLALPQAAISADAELLRQTMYTLKRPQLLGLSEAMEAVRRGALDVAGFKTLCDRYGLSDRAYGALVATLPQLFSVEVVLESVRRGLLDLEDARERLHAQGFEYVDADTLLALRYYVPQPPDVIRFAVREIYSPEIAERFGQFEDFPEAALPDFARAGISREDARKYWAAHWQLPSPEQVMDMIHRDAETGVTVDDLRTLLRAADVMPFWREKFIALATNPFTRVDIRRMHKFGVLTTEELPRAYRDIGYNEERAQRLADFTVHLNAGEDAAAAEPWRASLRSRAQGLYVDGILSPGELAETLAAIGHSEEEIAFYVAESQFILDGERAKDLRTGLRNLYVGGYWTAGKVVTRMLEAGYEQTTIDHLLQTWDLAKEVRDATAEDRAQRDLTRADILGALGDGIIAEPEARSSLMDLGYDDHEATVLIQREKLKGVQAERKRVEGVVRGGYFAGKVDEHEARGILGAAEIPAARIEALIRSWVSEVAATAPTLTLAQVTAALRRDILQRDEAARRIDRLGYSVEDRNILLDLAGKADVP